MKAVVVYESLWGNTAAVARAIAEGIGPEARALSTAEATGEAMTGVDLIVAGAPVLGFKLPTEKMRQGERAQSRRQTAPTGRSLAPVDAIVARCASGGTRPLGGVRHSGPGPVRQGGADDRRGPGDGRLCSSGGARRLRRQRQVRAPAEGRAGAARGAGVASWPQPMG